MWDLNIVCLLLGPSRCRAPIQCISRWLHSYRASSTIRSLCASKFVIFLLLFVGAIAPLAVAIMPSAVARLTMRLSPATTAARSILVRPS